MDKREQEEQDLKDLIDLGVFHKKEGCVREVKSDGSVEKKTISELALPIHEGNGTVKSIWDRILYPFRVWKYKRREAQIRKDLFKNLGE